MSRNSEEHSSASTNYFSPNINLTTNETGSNNGQSNVENEFDERNSDFSD